MSSKVISKNLKDTQKIAQDFVCLLKMNKKSATLVCLSGELGTGKTHFTQFVAKEFGINKKLKSPTFVIMNRYNLKNKNFTNFFHLDAYRLKNAEELLNLGWKEIISNPEHLVFIEWPENVAKAIPKKHHKISISHTEEGYRSFKIKSA